MLSFTVMLGDVFVRFCDGSMRRRSRGCSPFARSRSRRLTYIRRVLPAESIRSTWGAAAAVHCRDHAIAARRAGTKKHGTGVLTCWLAGNTPLGPLPCQPHAEESKHRTS